MNKHLHINYPDTTVFPDKYRRCSKRPNRQYPPLDNLSVSPYYDDREELAGTTNIPATTLQ